MEGYTGEVRQFAGTFCPRNWAFCAGQTIKIQNNAALFSIIGTAYGGDGMQTFQLPDMRYDDNGRKVYGWEIGKPVYMICMYGIFPDRE
jgi:microcystin-dependent protein